MRSSLPRPCSTLPAARVTDRVSHSPMTYLAMVRSEEYLQVVVSALVTLFTTGRVEELQGHRRKLQGNAEGRAQDGVLGQEESQRGMLCGCEQLQEEEGNLREAYGAADGEFLRPERTLEQLPANADPQHSDSILRVVVQ
eukprot:GHVU01210837.1.p2 GENE.GHVU01210837.1~~GHVU01210837.1.p2  ORF type:complete len:140 (-),score=15.05 GHVU01210837.1:130-549(-)